MDTSADVESPDVWADLAQERLGTPANVVTLVRTVASVVVAGVAVRGDSLPLLLVALGLYWAGDLLDGVVARVLHCESRVGAVLDILADRTRAAAFYVGLVWHDADLVWPVLVYRRVHGGRRVPVPGVPVLAGAQPQLLLRRRPAAVAVELVQARQGGQLRDVRGDPAADRQRPLGLAIATALLVLKCASLVRLMRLGLPIPAH